MGLTPSYLSFILWPAQFMSWVGVREFLGSQVNWLEPLVATGLPQQNAKSNGAKIKFWKG